MAGLDTSIALGIRPVDFGDPNEGRMNALRAQMMQMQMQQGQFNMMKAQRDMEYQDQQRAQAAAAAARDKAAEAQAFKLYGQTGAPGYQTYSPSMEPGAASDVGMLGGGQGYTEGAVNRFAVPAQPKSFDDAIANALAKGDAASVLAARKLMAQKEAQNVYTESNLKVKKTESDVNKAKSDASSAEAKAIDENLKPFRAYAAAVNSPEAAAAYVSAMFDHPVLGTMAQKVSGQTKDQAIAAAMKDYAADPQRWMAAHVGLTGEQVMKALGYGEEKTAKTTKIQQLHEYRDKIKADLAANPEDATLQQALAEVTANINKEAKFTGGAHEEGRKGFDAALKDIADQYKKLGSQGMLITPQSSIGNRAAAVLSDLAPGVTAIVSPERGAPVAALKNLRENMKAAIIQASGGALTSKNFDSNAEAKSLLDSMSSPGQPLDAIVDTLNSLSRKYGAGNVITAEDLTGGKEQNTSTGKSKPPLSSFAR
jgi:hypothetical protein